MARKLISATRLRNEIFDGASDMWLWRKLNDPELNFPRPIYIANRRYFDEAEVFDWIEAQAVASQGAL
ncbi:helix-turn-helix transcriptional regulator [Paracoccus tegillarcae]|uniref:Transcriptional regulator n=1 Tax=Paracoccus tegillarcae TaxID=1529068 RepID=A0A2K9EB07_9RHOB|nr:transcriptional regulator [Paracoccus tegillarcae]AUH32068.1 transcriptional regulator [Paracoccus tegillarcae]